MTKQRLIGRSNLRVKLRDDIVIEKFKSGDQDAHLYIGYECNFLRKRGLSKEAKYDGGVILHGRITIRDVENSFYDALDFFEDIIERYGWKEEFMREVN